jgi:hypothetical protein
MGKIAMYGDELPSRLKRLGLKYTAAAPLLGLPIDGLHRELRGYRPVSHRTEFLLEQLELRRQTKLVLEQRKKGSDSAHRGTSEDGRDE